ELGRDQAVRGHGPDVASLVAEEILEEDARGIEDLRSDLLERERRGAGEARVARARRAHAGLDLLAFDPQVLQGALHGVGLGRGMGATQELSLFLLLGLEAPVEGAFLPS